MHCYYYIGSHKMKHQRLGEFMRKIMEAGWNEYQDEHLTGFLIYYTDVYIHILEVRKISLFSLFISKK